MPGVGRQHRRRIVAGIDGERHQPDIAHGARGGILKLAHLPGHHGARAVAGGVEEVGYPDVSRQRAAVEGIARLRGELEFRHFAEHLQRRRLAAGGQEQKGQECGAGC